MTTAITNHRTEAVQREAEAQSLLSDAVLKRTDKPVEAALDVAIAQVSTLLAINSRLYELAETLRETR